MMTRKDYRAFAGAINELKDEYREILGAGSVLKAAAERMADIFEMDNERFRREQFLAAAGFAKEE